MMTKPIFAAAIGAFLLTLTTIEGLAAEVVIYNASDSVNTPLVKAFKTKYPGIEVKFVSGSTGPIAERAIAEKAKPQADVVYLVNNVALDQLKQAGVFEPYKPKNSKINPAFREVDGFYT